MPTKTSRLHSVKYSGDGAFQKMVRNTILLGLPHKEIDAKFEKLERVDLPAHAVLHAPGKSIEFGYFIDGGLASLLTVMSDGKSVEVGLCGNEGFIGVPLVVGLQTSPTLAVMQISGSALRIRSEDLVRALRRSPELEKTLDRFAQELMMQATQIAACNRVHGVEARLARWLLMSQDRLESDLVSLTQQTFADMLGTRRASVTVAAGVLQKQGLITYNRGQVQIQNRRRLEAASCECYRKLNEQFRRWQNELK